MRVLDLECETGSGLKKAGVSSSDKIVGTEIQFPRLKAAGPNFSERKTIQAEGEVLPFADGVRILSRTPRPQSYRICFPRFDLPFVAPENGSTQRRAMVQTLKSSTGTLSSWKEIAQYLDRGVRTIQRWERGLGLPVHRIGKGKRSPVFATASELNFWLTTVVVDSPSKPLPLEPPCIHRATNSRIQSLRQSCLTMRNLCHAMAENTARQRRQAELAREQMIKLRSRMNRVS